MENMSKEPMPSAMTDAERGYRLTIGRDVIRVISVFNGTKTASEAIHEAAVKKILFEKAMG